MLFATVVIGTIGYNILWADKGASFVDSLYMTMITITTIGYTEVYKLDQSGRLFTIFIGIVGIGSLFYLLGVVMENLFTIQILNLRGQKKMKKKLDELENHIIIVGYGRVGHLTAEELKNQGQEFLIIDRQFEDEDDISDENLIAFEADATDDDDDADDVKSFYFLGEDGSTVHDATLLTLELHFEDMVFENALLIAKSQHPDNKDLIDQVIE